MAKAGKVRLYRLSAMVKKRVKRHDGKRAQLQLGVALGSIRYLHKTGNNKTRKKSLPY